MLKIEGVKKKYKNFELDCSLEVADGNITGLIGQNGAGKSTAFKAALGLIKIEDGSISIFGKDISELTTEDKEKLGVAILNAGFSEYLTVGDIIKILRNTYKSFDEKYFTEQAERFQLPLNKKIMQFSNGMKAKLRVLTAISHDAKLLILDEPTAGLDVVARDEILEILRDFMEADENRAILISSHISSDLEKLCDDIYMIHEGKIVLNEETDVLHDEYAVLKVDEAQYEAIDKEYILRVIKESYGYNCLTNQKHFYAENYPHITIENGTIDELLTMMIRGR